MADIHDFGYDRQSCFCLCFFQQFNAFAFQTLESVRGSSGLKCTAAEQACAGFFHTFRNVAHLLSGLYGARTSNDLEIAAANLHAADVHHQVFIVEFSVCIFKWLLYPFYVFYNVQCSYQIHIHLRGIPHQTDDGMGFSNGNMGFNPHAVNPRFQVFQLFRFCILFQYNNHSTYLLHDKTLPFIAAYPSFLQKRKTPQRISLRSPICPSKEKNNKTNRLFLTAKFTLNL